MSRPGHATGTRRLHRYSPEVVSPRHDIEERSSDESWMGKKYDRTNIDGSCKVHMGDSISSATFNFVTGTPQRLGRSPPREPSHVVLLKAVKDGQTPRVKYALGPEVNASFDHQYQDQLTALHIAVWYGHLDCVKLLVDRGADVNATSFKYGTPLCVAAFRGHLRIVITLLGIYHAKMDADGGWLGSPAHAACLRQSNRPVTKDLLRQILKFGGALCGSRKVNLDFWKHHREDPSAPSHQNHYLTGDPIHIASYFGQKNAVDCLLAAKANVDSLARRSEPDGDSSAELRDVTALMLASMHQSNTETLATLLRGGASPELQDSKGFTPLLYAAGNDSTHSPYCLTALINSGCNIDAVSHEGFTALTVAARHGHQDSFSILRDAGAYLFHVDNKSWTLMKHAYRTGHLPALLASIGQAMLIIASRWFAVGLCGSLTKLASTCQQLGGVATHFEEIRRANSSDDGDDGNDGNDGENRQNTYLSRLFQLTEKCNVFLQHIAVRTRQDSKPLFAVNDVVLSCCVLGFAPCLVPIIVLKWESEKTTLPWFLAAACIFNKIRSLVVEIQDFLREFESTTAEEQALEVKEDPG